MIDPDLAEWDYGAYEGLTTARSGERPGWELFADGVPDGETSSDVGARVDRVIGRVRAVDGDVACVAHSHVLRVLAARWIGLGPRRRPVLCVLGPARSASSGWDREQPVVVEPALELHSDRPRRGSDGGRVGRWAVSRRSGAGRAPGPGPGPPCRPA